ncbi:SGNH/GDSL hydrolase family protein [candidate division WOR-3 bacterium]|nr:SGNH/GDSL hydrolase family protein [candidate division WOR-3 bacterium]
MDEGLVVMASYSLKKRIIFSIIAILLCAFCVLSLGEVYIRLTREYCTPEIMKSRSLEYSPALFAVHVFPLKEQNIEKEGWLINSKGYRGKDFSQKKDDEIIRVIVYGGSAVFDPNMPNGKDWPSQLEVILQQKGITNIEVINAGIPGHATFDSFGRLFTEGHIFQPDYVVLYNAWNDIKYFSFEEPLLRKLKPYDEADDFRIGYRGRLDRMLCKSSQLYVYLRDLYYTWKYHVGGEGIVKESECYREIQELGLKQYRLNVEMFADLARNINAVPILVKQARLVSRNNTDEEKSIICYKFQGMQHQTLVDAFEKTDDIIADIAKSKNVAMADPSKQMTGKSAYFSDHIHLSDAGSKKLAMILSDYLFTLIKSQ